MSLLNYIYQMVDGIKRMQIQHKQEDISLEVLTSQNTEPNAAAEAAIHEYAGLVDMATIMAQASAPNFTSEVTHEDMPEIPTENTVVSKTSQEDLFNSLFGSISEVTTDLATSDKQFAIALYKDGIWEKRNNKIGSFVFHRTKLEVPYISKTCTAKFEFKLPKIPGGILNETVRMFKDVMAKLRGSEAMVQIFWDETKKDYMIYVPEQYVSGASIRFLHNKEHQSDSNLTWVLDIHSHNTMGAFFSGGDDRDEKSTRVFAVLGNLDKPEFSHKWRAGCNSKYYDLNLTDLIDMENKQEYKIADGEEEKIKHYSDMPNELKDKATYISGGTPAHYNGGTTHHFGGYYPHGIYGGNGHHFPYQTGGYRTSNGPVKYTSWHDEDNRKSSKKDRKRNKSFEKFQARYPQLFKRVKREEELPDPMTPYGFITDEDKNSYDFSMSFSHNKISNDCYRGLKEVITDFKTRIKNGPTVMYSNIQDTEYDYGSQVLLELLDTTLTTLAVNIDIDLNQNKQFKDSLEDICINFATVLSNFPDMDRYLNIMGSEIEKILDKTDKQPIEGLKHGLH